MAFCTKCGTQLTDGAKFCASCGTSAEGTISEPKTAAKKESVFEKLPTAEAKEKLNAGKEKVNAGINKLPFKKLAEEKISASARAKFPLLEKAIPFANQIVCGLAALVATVVIVAAVSSGGSSGGSASAALSGTSWESEEKHLTLSDLTADDLGIVLLYDGAYDVYYLDFLDEKNLKMTTKRYGEKRNRSDTLIKNEVDEVLYKISKGNELYYKFDPDDEYDENPDATFTSDSIVWWDDTRYHRSK
jgi:hypothetical protein